MRVFGGLVALMLLAVAVPAQGQITSCGDDYELFMRNPDLKPQQDGRFHVSGDFFVQFQVIGENAGDIEAFAMSVGLPPENPEQVCDLAYWPAGLVLESYKVDTDKEDGFHLLLNTESQSTPQNTDLQVAVHGYDGDGNELARFWGLGIVESCEGPVGGCAEAEQNDDMMPWPIILPGDGAKTYVDGFTVEFGEALESYQVLLNSEDITDQMEPWEGRVWDADTFYDYGPFGVFQTLAPPCSQPEPVQTCVQSPGPSLQWTQRTITPADVIRVVATDVAGNVAQKEIHVGSSVAGGTIADGLPVLTMTFKETQQLTAPGGTAVFQARMENTGGGTGHPLVSADIPANWTYEWTPGHKPVEAASEAIQELNVVVPPGTPAGIYPLTAIMEYQQGQADKRLESALEILVGGDNEAANNTVDAGDEADVEESPGLGPVAAVAVLAWALRRRH